MANLDDLFTKRDKKKKTTTKSKFSTLDANEFAKQLEATSSRADDDGDFQQDGSDRFGNFNSNDNMDEEWKPFDSEDNRDYSGLRIIQWKVEERDTEYGGGNDDGDRKQEFKWGANSAAQGRGDEPNPDEKDEKATDDSPAQNEKEASTEEPSNVESSTDKAKTEGEEQPTQPASSGAYIPPALRRTMQAQAPAAAPEAKPAAAEAAGGSKYVPPHLRGKTGDSSSTGSSSSSSSSAIPPTSVNFNRNRPNKSQPNILDTSEFPTLDSAGVAETTTEKAVNGGEKFEMPKKAARIEPKSNDSTINLDNKFNALSTNN